MRDLPPGGLPFSLLAALLAFMLALQGGGCRTETGGAAHYHCPMHPTYVSDRQGDCPICGMRLVPIQPESGKMGGDGVGHDQQGRVAPGAVTGRSAPTAAYICSMCPEVQADEPGRCPICGMRLQANPHRAAINDTTGVTGVTRSTDATAAAARSVPGLAPVSLSADALRLARVRTVPAVRERFHRTVRVVGVVKPDETRLHRVQTKITGWVEQLFVNFVGQEIRAGAPMLSIYSQELLATQEELLHAREAAARFGASSLPEVQHEGEALLAAARLRLELFDVPLSFIAELERTGRPQRAVTLAAPASGYVLAKEVNEGQRVEPGMDLLMVADLSQVWVEAAFYEFEAPWLSLGQLAVLTLPHDPALRRQGRVSYVYPALDPATRSLPVRFDFPNPDLALKPGMFADVELQLDAGEGIVVPADAVMDTGVRQITFVEEVPGRFTPRLVRVAARSGGKALIAEGLRESELVVVHANFLLDSESRLRAMLSGAGAAAGDGAGPNGHLHGGDSP